MSVLSGVPIEVKSFCRKVDKGLKLKAELVWEYNVLKEDSWEGQTDMWCIKQTAWYDFQNMNCSLVDLLTESETEQTDPEQLLHKPAYSRRRADPKVDADQDTVEERFLPDGRMWLEQGTHWDGKAMREPALAAWCPRQNGIFAPTSARHHTQIPRPDNKEVLVPQLPGICWNKYLFILFVQD